MKGAFTMEYSTAREIYQKLNAATKGDEDAEILYRDLVKLAVDYARRRDMLTEDRKEIGDFACYLHAMLGVEAR